jgi:choline monooxygenase
MSWRVDPDIALAETLPAQAFADPAFLDLELRTIFQRSWLLAPQRTAEELRADSRSLEDLLALRGSHVPVNVLDRPLFLQRDWQGQLHAFPNVCTHAWFPLVSGPGRERSIVCRQHARRFECDGRYVSQPGFEGVPARPEDDLERLPVAEWQRLLFLAFEEPAMRLPDLLREVTESTACLPLAELARRPQPAEVREIDGNWKQHAWNYMDVFHLAYIHRAPGGLADALEMDSYRTELYARTALQWAYAARPEHGFEPDLLPERFRHPAKRVFALWWFVFPNLTLNFYPWGLSINVYMPVPNQPGRTLFLWYHYVLDDARYALRDDVWLNRQVDAEDVDAMRQVSRGVRSGLARRGRFSPTREAGPHWFHRLVAEGVA